MNVDGPRVVVLGTSLSLLCIVALVVGLAMVPGSVGVATATDDDPPRHENPETYDGGSSGEIDERLAAALSGRLDEVTTTLDDGDYERARAVLGEEYASQLRAYVDANGGDASTGDSGETDRLERAIDRHESFVDAVERFDRDLGAYEEAVEDAGPDSDLAVERARNVDESGATAVRRGNRARTAYAAVAETLVADDGEQAVADDVLSVTPETENLSSGTDSPWSEDDGTLQNGSLAESVDDPVFTAVDRSISGVVEVVERDRTAVRTNTFEKTVVVFDRMDSGDGTFGSIAFDRPLSTTGQVRTVDGDPVANERVQLWVEGTRRTVETDGEGRFTLQYRPTTIPVATESVTVRYRPTPGAPYRGNETELPVSIEQVEPTITIEESPSTVGGTDVITVAGTLAVDGTPVETRVPFAVRIGDERVGTIEATNGSFTGEIMVPPTVSVGEHDLIVEQPRSDRALAAGEATRELTVEGTRTSIQITGVTPVEGAKSVHTVTGRFETSDGEPVADAALGVTVDGESVGTVTTADDGTFDATASIPTDGATVAVTYDDEGTNLGNATATETVTPGSGSLLSGTTATVVASIAILVALAVAAWWWRSRREAESEGTGDDVGAPGTGDGERDERGAGTPARTATAHSLLGTASERIGGGREADAVVAAYAAVRTALGDPASDRPLTHWEFYRRYGPDGDAVSSRSTGGDRSAGTERWADEPAADGSSGDGATEDALKAVTIAYERAAYARQPTAIEEAETTLSQARRLCYGAGVSDVGPDGSAD